MLDVNYYFHGLNAIAIIILQTKIALYRNIFLKNTDVGLFLNFISKEEKNGLKDVSMAALF